MGVFVLNYPILECNSHLNLSGRERRLELVPMSVFTSFVHGSALSTHNLHIEPTSVSPNTTACSTFAWGNTAQEMYLVAALAEKIIIFRYDVTTNTFDALEVSKEGRAVVLGVEHWNKLSVNDIPHTLSITIEICIYRDIVSYDY